MDEKTINGMKRPELLSLIKEIIQEINSIYSSLEKVNESKDKVEQAENQVNNENGLLSKIKSSKIEIDEKLEKIREAYQEICEDGEDLSIKTELGELLETFKGDERKIESFKEEIWGRIEEDEDGNKKKVEGLFDHINNFHGKQKEKYNLLYDKIEKELLPGSTTVKLAKIFEDKVREYSRKGKWWTGAFVTVIGATTIYYGVTTFKTDEINGLSDIWLHFFFRAPFIIFIIWLAIFFSNRRAETKKLEESYKHKEVMARSFVGYRESIKDLDNEDQKLLKSHMDKLLNTMNVNSSDFLKSKGEKHPFHDFVSIFTGKKLKDNEE